MKKFIFLLCLSFAIPAFTNTPVFADDYLSPLALTADEKSSNIYVAQFTANQVAAFNTNSAVSRVIRQIEKPSGLAISPDGSQLYVTSSTAKGTVYIINLKDAKILCSIAVGHSPLSPVISPDGRTLYVCNQFNNNISVIDLDANKETSKIAVEREPVTAAITPDGKLLFVANLLPTGPANADFVAASVSVIDTRANCVVNTVTLPNGSTSLRGICIAPNGKYAYITHILAHFQLPTTQLERGWMNTNALSIIDARKQTLLKTVLLDDIDSGAANPWAVKCTPDGKYLCVSHSGTHEVSIIDRQAMHKKLADFSKDTQDYYGSSSQNSVINDLSFMFGIRQRIALKGNGPRGMTISGNKIYLAEYFSDSLGIVNTSDSTVTVSSIKLNPLKNTPLTAVRRGEMLFHDASLCFQKWQSCATCHPGSARMDGLNWDLLNDGMGNPKNTKSLLFSHKTPPSMITGVREKAEDAVRAGIKHIQFMQYSEENASAIDEYLKSLEPLPSPYFVDGRLSEAAKRGQNVYKKAGCITCHTEPLHTDMKKYDVGTGTGTEKDRHFDTPTIIEAWRTAPYLFDGRAVTIKQVLTKFNPQDKHGETSKLTEQEIDDLAEFVLSQ